MEYGIAFQVWTLQCDERSFELAFVVVENTLKYFSMVRCGRSLAKHEPVIPIHVVSAPVIEHFLRQCIHILPSSIARDRNHIAT